MRIYKYIVLILNLPLLAACLHSDWKLHRNQMIGKNINDHTTYIASWNNFEDAKKLGLIIDKNREPPNIRYYINKPKHCFYSVLVAPNGTILSWKFENYDKRKNCSSQ